MSYDIEKEKREAIDAGRRALQCLQAAQEDLRSAKNWGICDMIGGGIITSMLKRSKMEKAKQNMERARYALKDFGDELADVNRSCHLDIETGDFLSFADWFFDGFFVDWMVQSRIDKAADQVTSAIFRVENILEDLQS